MPKVGLDYHFVLFPGSMDLISLDLAASFTETSVTISPSVPLWIAAIYLRYSEIIKC